MTPDKLRELMADLNCVQLFLHNKKYEQYHSLVRDIYLTGLSNIDYAKKHNINRGSVEHQKHKLHDVFADFMAMHDLAQCTADEMIEGDLVMDADMFKSAELKMKVFEMLEEAKLLDQIVEREMRAQYTSLSESPAS